MADESLATQTLHLRLISEAAPPKEYQDRPTAFGLKDKKRELHNTGIEHPDGSVQFDVEVQLQTGASGDMRFKGPFVLGTKDDPYIGIIWNYADEPVTIRGQKIRLDHIPRKLLHSMTPGKPGMLQAVVLPITEKTATIPVEWTAIFEGERSGKEVQG